MLDAIVVGADTPERDGGEDLLIEIKGLYRRLKKVWADGGFSGDWFKQAAKRLGREIEVVKRSDDMKGFAVLPKRWIVERTFAWLGRYRRLSKDYESLASSSVTMIQLAMINLMVHRLKPG